MTSDTSKQHHDTPVDTADAPGGFSSLPLDVISTHEQAYEADFDALRRKVVERVRGLEVRVRELEARVEVAETQRDAMRAELEAARRTPEESKRASRAFPHVISNLEVLMGALTFCPSRGPRSASRGESLDARRRGRDGA